MIRVPRTWARPLVLGGLLVLLGALPAGAQQGEPQYVDSLEAYQRRIEGLLHERLSALVPSGNFVLRATVSGVPARLPRAALGGATLDLPGFRPSAGEAVPGEEKFRVEQVVVRIVLNQALPPSDLQYLRTVVPILADFRPERGDRLDMQVIPPSSSLAEAAQAAGETPAGFPAAAAPGAEDKGPSSLGLGERPFGLSWTEWLLVGLLVVLLLIVIRVFMRALSRPPAPPPPVYPPREVAEAAQAAQSAKGELEAEQRRLDQQRQVTELTHSVVRHIFARPELVRDLIAEWQGAPTKLNALIHGLGPTLARQAVMPHVGREAYHDMEETVRQERAPDLTRQIGALQEANLFLVTQEITRPELIKPNPFRFLDQLTWGQIAHLIRDEPINVKAIVLSRLKAEDTARILEMLPKDLQLEIAVGIGNLHDLPLEMAESVATDLALKARNVPDARLVDIEGPQALVDMMGRTSSTTSRYLLEAMKSKDTKLSAEVERRFFLFEAIPIVPDEILPQAVRTLPSGTVITALQGAPPELQRKVIMAFPDNARPGLVTALRASRADPEAVEEARRQVVAKFQALAMQGRINLKQISDAWQAQAS
jgi:flagellar motor switch protein FliG